MSVNESKRLEGMVEMLDTMQGYKELVAKVDNLVAFGLKYNYKKSDTAHSRYFDGKIDTLYCFTYAIVDDNDLTIQDAIDTLNDDIRWLESVYFDLDSYEKGVLNASRTIVNTLHLFEDNYKQVCAHPYRHPYSIMYIHDFNMAFEN